MGEVTRPINFGNLGSSRFLEGSKRPSLFKSGLKPFKLQGQGSNPLGHNYVGNKVEAASDLVDGYVAVGGDGRAVGQEVHASPSTEHYAAELALGVF